MIIEDISYIIHFPVDLNGVFFECNIHVQEISVKISCMQKSAGCSTVYNKSYVKTWEQTQTLKMLPTHPFIWADGAVHFLEIFTWFVVLSLDFMAPVIINVILPAVPATKWIDMEFLILIMILISV